MDFVKNTLGGIQSKFQLGSEITLPKNKGIFDGRIATIRGVFRTRNDSVMLIIILSFIINSMSHGQRQWGKGTNGVKGGGGPVAREEIGQLIDSMGLVWREARNHGVQRTTTLSNGLHHFCHIIQYSTVPDKRSRILEVILVRRLLT